MPVKHPGLGVISVEQDDPSIECNVLLLYRLAFR
jgi:hypothetical protein